MILMISKEMNDLLNDQINEELFSSYLYLSMANYFSSISLEGFVNYFTVQAQEELFHGIKIQNYINERGGRVILKAIKNPKTEWNSVLEVVKETADHERFISSCFNKIMDKAIEIKDYSSHSTIQWFIDEQVEEEASADGLVDKMKLIDGSNNGLFILDKELSLRVFTPPV